MAPAWPGVSFMAGERRATMRLPEVTAPLDVDGDFTGATIIVRTRPIGLVFLLRAQELIHVCLDDERRAEWKDAGIELADLFATHGLLSWDLEDHLGEIPATREGMGRLTFGQQTDLAIGWVSKVVNPPRPLSPPSSNTGRPRAARRSRKS